MTRSFAFLRPPFLAAVLASSSLPACSSSSANPPASPSPDAQFCAAVVSSSTRCHGGADAGACENAGLAEFSDDCTQAASLYSTALKSAYVACGASAPCVPVDVVAPIDVLATSCGETAARGVLSAAQNKLALDYCTVCAGTAGLSVAMCEGAFWSADADGGTILTGIGYGALPYSDAIVDLVDTRCIPDLDAGSQLGCIEPFAGCVSVTTATAVTSAFPPSAACGASTDGG